MVPDRESNFVYLSSLFAAKCPQTFQQLTESLDRMHIPYGFLSHTKDLWVADFMPIQVKHDQFVQFTYDPDYLRTKKEQPTKSDPSLVCDTLGIVPNKVPIVLDGGNLVKCKTKVILTTKVFKENPSYTETELINAIKAQLEVTQVVVIPQEPKDFVGHSDGMVRFVDEETVLVNQYPDNKDYREFGFALRWSLRNAGLRCIELAYTSWENRDENDATGCYINFLEIGNYIFCPTFSQSEDELAYLRLKETFSDRYITGVNCIDLAKRGGVLNCATWNILKN